MIERNFDNYMNLIQETASKKKGNSFTIENEFVPVMVNNECEVVLRLLPQPKSETAPFVENRTHSFYGSDGKWHVVDCLRKAGHKCPICEWNSEVFKAFPQEEAKKISKKKAKRSFISNVLVIKNPAKPDTEGKVYRFKYGIQIMEKILEKMKDKEDPDKGHIDGCNVFDYYKGANLIFKAKVGKYGPNPEESYFGDPKPISDKNNVPLTDEQIQEIDNNLYTLKDCEKDTSSETWEEILGVYEKYVENEKLWKKTTKEDGTVAYEPIIPGAPAGKAPSKAADAASAFEPEVDKASAESSEEFLNGLL